MALSTEIEGSPESQLAQYIIRQAISEALAGGFLLENMYEGLTSMPTTAQKGRLAVHLRMLGYGVQGKKLTW